MREIIPQKLKILAERTEAPLYVVGGACRDFMAGLHSSAPADWDICAPLSAEKLVEAAKDCGFEISGVYKNTGTVRLSCGGEAYEFTSFRSDRYVRGVHSPAEVYFTDDIEKDARRRDFKCNALYYDVAGEKFVDPLGASEEIKNKIISTVCPAEKVFGEDGLRLMRLARIAAQTGFVPTEECLDGARANRALIDDIKPERIFAELSYILSADIKYGVEGAQYRGLKILHSVGVLERILPELAAGDKMAQRSDFHAHDVLEHTLRCVLYSHPSIRLAALLHDVGKPKCKIETGKFARHEEVGEQIARDICLRYRVSGKLTEETCALVRLHMYDLSGEASENKVRKFIIKNLPVLDKLLLLKQADFSASRDDLSVAPCVTKWKNIYDKMISEGVPMTLKQLNVRGDELIGAGICPDEVGKTLNFLLGECAIGALPNERERLIKVALSSHGRK